MARVRSTTRVDREGDETEAESAFIFRCKPPLGASSPFTSAESAFIFRCRLCIPLGTTFEQKTYAALL
jgi:hypothetical protein